MHTAKAAVYVAAKQPFEIREYPLTAPPPGMAKLRLIASGVCGTDIHIHRGKIALEPPKIIGHEFVGRVEEIGEEDSRHYGIRTGDAVIVDIASPCGKCLLCRQNDDANCLHMQVTNGNNPEQAPHFWGGYGEYNYSPVQNLIKIPTELDPKLTCVYACAGPTALHAFALAEQANCRLETVKTAVVQGLGPVGTFAAAYLASLGISQVICITAGDNPLREDVARRLGATEIRNLSRESEKEIAARIADLTDGVGADLVFEASGNPQAVPMGMQLLRNRGVYLVPGQYSNSGPVEIQPQNITFKALHIIGSSQYSLQDVRQYLHFMATHPRLHPTISSLITAYPLDEINQAFADAKAGKNIKTLLV